ncbi:hypothetical protein [Burkholderia cepacia]|uniref:hypothetical protein n=1 Tax=Burkholderia cepacia TaxID=292 RepID=UPI001CF2D3B5|nr:hypothetical protein [Burkholderia cepacia]MCA8135671.1 hypothetical protein [Burkholderia cepacia]
MQQDHILNPYLTSEPGVTNPYTAGMVAVLEKLKPFLTSKQLDDLECKLQLKKPALNEPQYLQSACELSICGFFARKFPTKFEYEPVITAPKDVDCAFETRGYRFNIEVKCADFSKKNALDQTEGFQLATFGRHPDLAQVHEDLQRALSNDPAGRQVHLQLHMDNKLKDFLISAHGKFADSTHDDTLNVLAVCGDSPSDMQKWFGYLYGPQGLFREDSYHPVSDYTRVDVVLLTNLYHRHYSYREKDQIADHWDLGKAFNVIFSNPYRQRDKKDAILQFTTVLPNHSWQLDAYKVKGDDLAPDVAAAIRMSSYIGEKLADSGMFQMRRDSNDAPHGS